MHILPKFKPCAGPWGPRGERDPSLPSRAHRAEPDKQTGNDNKEQHELSWEPGKGWYTSQLVCGKGIMEGFLEEEVPGSILAELRGEGGHSWQQRH